ncbi:ubiquitin-conjugating enzyme E2 T isoform 1-T1 [Acanthopagrus schlegelii]
MQRASRLKRELQMLSTEPPPGITCWQAEERIDDLRAQIMGGTDTPYDGGLFSLEIKVPERYPFEPPKIRFLTPIYHPNIDNSGRICHDALKLPPKGAWKPSLNISTVLTSIQLLMAEPNPDDPLMADIDFCRELSCTILAIAASRKQPVSAHGTTHLSTARGTQAILLPSDLHLLLNDKLKTSKQRMQTRRPVLIPQQTHSLICLLTVLFIPLRFEPTE